MEPVLLIDENSNSVLLCSPCQSRVGGPSTCGYWFSIITLSLYCYKGLFPTLGKDGLIAMWNPPKPKPKIE